MGIQTGMASGTLSFQGGKAQDAESESEHMELKVSIIVPVYNVRPYLEKCVLSLLDQDLLPDEYEIILVDDGSTDGGGELCDQFAIRHGNIRVLHQANQGLSVARNTGLSVAVGKYVQFVDSDDWIVSGVLKGLVRRMEEDSLDVLRFGYQRIAESGEVVTGWNAPVDNDCAGRVQSGSSFLVHHLWYSCYAWQFMLQREFLSVNHLLFMPGILFEDTEWTPRVMESAQRVCGVNTLVYNYLERPGSITRGKVRRKLDSHLLVIDRMQEQMQGLSDKRWHSGMIAQTVVSIVSSLALELYEERKPYLAQLKTKGVYPLSSYLATRKAVRKIRLINLSPSLACFLIHLAFTRHL